MQNWTDDLFKQVAFQNSNNYLFNITIIFKLLYII